MLRKHIKHSSLPDNVVCLFCRNSVSMPMVSIYHGHLRGPVTLSSIAGRLAVELTLPVLTT